MDCVTYRGHNTSVFCVQCLPFFFLKFSKEKTHGPVSAFFLMRICFLICAPIFSFRHLGVQDGCQRMKTSSPNALMLALVLFLGKMENDFVLAVVILLDWQSCLMRRKNAVKLPFSNVVKYLLPSLIFTYSLFAYKHE